LAARRAAHVVRLNTERAAEWQVSVVPGETWRVESDARALASEACAGVWWRRPESPPRPAEIEPTAWEAICDQWRALLMGMVSVPGPRWVSSPFAIRSAESKAVQLSHAAAVGFRVPRTVWTNALPAAERLLSEQGGDAVCKPLATAHWVSGDESHFVFARRVGLEELPPADRLARSPVTFQQAIAPKRDIRATVVGERVVAAMREPDGAIEPVDWRLAEGGEWRAHELPADVRDACVRLVARLSLRFAGIDLLLDDEGRHWFVELNPNGEWAWLQAAGLPLAQHLADELLDR
jgi:ribosomal protein S6-L-glutamate ligase RimK-like protein